MSSESKVTMLYLVIYKHYRYFSESEFSAAHLIRTFRSFYGLNSPCEDVITIVSCL